jgi:hypothetical protein
MFSLFKANKIGLGARIAEILRKKYTSDRAKMIARDFRVSTGTAKRWLSGVAPTSSVIEEMVARWGVGFVVEAFSDALKAGDQRVNQLTEAIKTSEPAGSSVPHQTPSGPSPSEPVAANEIETTRFRRERPVDAWRLLVQELVLSSQ